MEGEECEIEDLEEGREVEVVDAEERGGGSRYEDAALVDGVVGRVECTVVSEWGGGEGEEESWCDALVDGVFGDVDQQQREHEWEEEAAGPFQVRFEL